MRKFLQKVVLGGLAVAWEVTVNRYATILPEFVFVALWLVPFVGVTAWLLSHQRVGRFVYARPMIALSLFLLGGAALGGVGWIGWRIVGTTGSAAKGAAPQGGQTHRTFRESDDFFISCGNNSYVLEPGIPVKLLGGEGAAYSFGSDAGDLIGAVLEDGRVLISAKLYSRGAQPVEVERNEFKLANSSWDRNFNDLAFEVVDQAQNPVLQLIYKTPRNVVVYGKFGTPSFNLWVTPDGIFGNPSNPHDPKLQIKRLFRYPSRKHQGMEIDDERPPAPSSRP